MTPNKFTAVFNQMLEQAQEQFSIEPADPSRILEVHPSQIPICPSSFILGFDPQNMVRTMNYMGTAIVREGTVLHSTIQEFLSQDERMFGDWVCPECGEFFPFRTGGQLCPNCERPLLYRELAINYKGFAGHTDCVVKLGDEYWLVDFKSSSYMSIANKVKQTPSNYDQQTWAYCLLLSLQYKLNIAGRAICYIGRDNPSYMKLGGVELFTKQIKRRTQKLLKEQRELLNFLLDCTSFKDYWLSVGPQRCGSEYCKVCKHTDTELKALLKAKFKQLGGRSIREYVTENKTQ